MALVVRVQRLKEMIPVEGLVICDHTDKNENGLTCSPIPIVAKLACTLNSLEDKIMLHLSVALDKKEVKDKLKTVVCHDVLIRACQEASNNPQYWRYKVNKLQILNTRSFVNFEKKMLTLLDADDLDSQYCDLSRQSIDYVYDVYYVETNNIFDHGVTSIHPVYEYELLLDTYNNHRRIYSSKPKDGDYQNLFNITTHNITHNITRNIPRNITRNITPPKKFSTVHFSNLDK